MNPGQLRERLQVYMDLRQALGIPVGAGAAVLADFVSYVETQNVSGPVTTQLALDWLDAYGADRKLATPARPLSLIRQFLMHVSSALPDTQIPDIGLLAAHRRPVPFVFTPAEVEAMMEAAASYGPAGSFLRVTLQAVLGLMACTGLRVSEALKLNRDHVMPKSNPADLLILETKFHKSRIVPLHPTTAKQLSIYAGHRELLGYSQYTTAFFVTDSGRRLPHAQLMTAYRGILDKLGVQPRGGSKRPTLQSLRHTFAVNRLRRWHEEKVDVRTRLMHLSTYLGHSNVHDTYWYLSATPELLATAGQLFCQMESDGGVE